MESKPAPNSAEKLPEPDGMESDQNAVTFQEFADGTSSHGVRYVANTSYHPIRRLVWLIVVLAMIGLLLFNVVHAFLTLFSYPQSTTITLTHVDNISFPAVTLCNINLLRRDALGPETLQLLVDLYGHPDGPHHSGVNLTGRGLFPDEPPEEAGTTFLASTHTIDDMLLNCRWQGRACSSRNFTFRLTDHGVCFTFNEPPEESQVLSVQKPGANGGLHLRLNIEQEQYTYGDTTGAGIKVYLHRQGEFPVIREHAFSLSPGFDASVVITKKQIESLKEPYKDACYDGLLKDLNYTYTVPACQFECKINFVVDKCKCRDARWPITTLDSKLVCDLERQTYCIYHYEEVFISEGIPCKCPSACTTIVYDSKVSLAYWPAANLMADLKAKENLTEEFVRKNYLEVYFFYEEVSYFLIEQKEAYSMGNLESDIGGYLGLLCGMSLITVVEWLDYGLLSLHRRLRGFSKYPLTTKDSYPLSSRQL